MVKIHYLCTTMNKINIDWIKALTFLVVAGGLMYITQSVMMTAGIVILLLVVDQILANWQATKEFKRLWNKEMNTEENEKP